jgi:hypothetical protein
MQENLLARSYIVVQKMTSTSELKQKSWIIARSAVLALIAIVIVYIAIHYLYRLYKLGCVDSAIVTMRTIVSSEGKFSESHPNLGYTCSLADLTPYSAVALEKKNGYVFEVTGCVFNKTSTNFVVVARPLQRGLPAFCSDQSGVLKIDYDGSVVNCVKKGQVY